jgi:hypothetical protein
VDERVARAETIEIDAMSDLHAAADAELGSELGLMAQWVGGAWAFGATGVADVIMNRVVGLGVFAPARRQDLGLFAEGYRMASIGRYLVHLVPGAQPAELAGWLAAAGFVPFRRAWSKLWRPAAAIERPSRLTAIEVGPDRADELAALIATVYGLPPAVASLFARLPGRPGWHCYLALDGGRAIGAAAMFARGAEAWFGFAATLADARGRGAQPLLLARRLTDAARLGCTEVFVETGDEVAGEPQPSHDNLVAVGFERLYSRANLVSPAAS